jgi:hypothetical protein
MNRFGGKPCLNCQCHYIEYMIHTRLDNYSTSQYYWFNIATTPDCGAPDEGGVGVGGYYWGPSDSEHGWLKLDKAAGVWSDSQESQSESLTETRSLQCCTKHFNACSHC